jgi:alpha-D-xyloside xylohydrolase
VLGKWHESRTVYDYSQGVEVCLYHTKPGARAVIVDGEGEPIGILEVGEDGELLDQDFLKGAWHCTKNGRSTVKSKAIEGPIVPIAL